MEHKTFEQIKNDIYNFKVIFGTLHDLIKIFIHEWNNITEEENYPGDDEYLAKNCLYTILRLIDEKTETS